ncbi:hypothetical protein [Thiorhodovibrio frisius]|uniref:Uncharacterized protein n=1 Tax=Thiorhodovibrio frisius TaxID=631362 RepID=H8Z2T1_9GAMM|nr:hypothetical protein [Thiorhodovibrio frisius]EIC21667.1 hypothetical protein Thi970DRAFT_01887 [Thiorhodovibrio frisius]WPL21636.1 hypothetical protein Thiofri_01762 [Thiorhodovibrio frisius]
MTTKFSELLEAFDFVSFGQMYEHQAFLHKESGKIFWHSEYGPNEEELPDNIFSDDYIEIPHKNDLGLGKDLVFEFADKYLPDQIGDIERIFSHKGAYSRYKALLEEEGLLEKWFDFENETQQRALKEWCKEHNIDILAS